jgi:hypothetical protein
MVAQPVEDVVTVEEEQPYDKGNCNKEEFIDEEGEYFFNHVFVFFHGLIGVKVSNYC